MVDADFDAVIISEEELRERYRLPGSTVEKVLPRLDQHARTFIENARFASWALPLLTARTPER